MDENGDGTMDQMEFISLVESRHPLLSKVAWAADLQKYFADDAWDDDGVAWVDPNRRPWLMLSPNDNFRMCWDIATAVLLVYVAIVEPRAAKGCEIPNFKGSNLGRVFHSFRLIFGRAIISRNDLEAWMLFPERARAEHSR